MYKKQYLFSIVIPVYNVKDYLTTCIESILNQQFKNYEIILIDDGSSDGSEVICDTYANKYENIKVIHKINEGPAIARNIGIHNSEGKYIIYLDSDDMLFENCLNDCSELVLNNENYDVYLGQKFKILFPGGTIEERIDKSKFDELDNDVLKNIIMYSPMSITYIWRNIYRTDFIKENNIYFKENILCGEDMDWNTEVYLKAKKVKTFDFYTHIYRGNRNGSIVTACSYNRVSDFYKIVNKWINYADKIEDRDLEVLLKNFYSKGFYSNLKYIYGFKEKEIFVSEIKNGTFWKYPVTLNNKVISGLKRILGIKVVLKILNLIYKFKISLKKILIKFKLIDR